MVHLPHTLQSATPAPSGGILFGMEPNPCYSSGVPEIPELQVSRTASSIFYPAGFGISALHKPQMRAYCPGRVIKIGLNENTASHLTSVILFTRRKVTWHAESHIFRTLSVVTLIRLTVSFRISHRDQTGCARGKVE